MVPTRVYTIPHPIPRKTRVMRVPAATRLRAMATRRQRCVSE